MLAAVLAATGIFGVVSYIVTTRTREIGIRVALGARGSQILLLTVGQGMRLALLGIATGVMVSLALPGGMSAILHGVSPRDPRTLVISTVVLLVIGTVANAIPALKAVRVDPAHALRLN
jgi:ABC-type antimicrobial peptide transport system permease subunit